MNGFFRQPGYIVSCIPVGDAQLNNKARPNLAHYLVCYADAAGFDSLQYGSHGALGSEA
jgi:hypothetical protein